MAVAELVLETAVLLVLLTGCVSVVAFRRRTFSSHGSGLLAVGAVLVAFGAIIDWLDDIAPFFGLLRVNSVFMLLVLEKLLGFGVGFSCLFLGLFRLTRHREAISEETEARYQRLVALSPDGIMVHTDGIIQVANQAMADILGAATSAELVGRDAMAFIPAEERDAVRRRRREARNNEAFGYRETAYVRLNGERAMVERAIASIMWEGRQSFLVVTRDITARKRAEAALRDSEARFGALLDNSPAAIFLKDQEGRLQFMNRRFVERHGQTHGELPGKTVLDILEPGEASEELTALDRQVLECGETAETEFTLPIPCGDGPDRRLAVIKFPVYDSDGRTIGVGTIQTDITDQRRAEGRLYQAQKMEAIGQLSGGIAHDFNNLLAVILGNTELLLEGRHDQAPLLENVRRAATRGAELTQRLLAYSRRQPLRPQPTDLAKLVDGMSGMLERTLGKAIKVEVGTIGDPWLALADPGQVENALLNLAINARDAMPDGGTVRIDCANVRLDDAFAESQPGASAGDYVMLSVKDTGVGMSAHVREHAFEPFFTDKEMGQGSGLGLSVIYGFVKQSGGHVSIESESGQGTTVRLYLPRAQTAGDIVPLRAVGDGVPVGEGERVLVIEDDQAVGDLVCRVLTDLGYAVVRASDGASARDALKSDPPVDIVLSDVVLADGARGPELIAEARRLRPDLKAIFMTGYMAAAAQGVSSDPLLRKPFQRKELADTLRETLGRG